MEVSSQFHAQAALLPVSTGEETGWTPELLWMQWPREKSHHCPCHELNLGRPARSLVSILNKPPHLPICLLHRHPIYTHYFTDFSATGLVPMLVTFHGNHDYWYRQQREYSDCMKCALYTVNWLRSNICSLYTIMSWVTS
jgi:hypothetical protein